jgi:hypothetical protein
MVIGVADCQRWVTRGADNRVSGGGCEHTRPASKASDAADAERSTPPATSPSEESVCVHGSGAHASVSEKW